MIFPYSHPPQTFNFVSQIENQILPRGKEEMDPGLPCAKARVTEGRMLIQEGWHTDISSCLIWQRDLIFFNRKSFNISQNVCSL